MHAGCVEGKGARGFEEHANFFEVFAGMVGTRRLGTLAAITKRRACGRTHTHVHERLLSLTQVR